MIDSSRIQRHVKIVCTLGPASNSPEVIEKMLHAGMNVVRLNLNYGSLDEDSRIIADVRRLSAKLGLPTGILLDLPGLKRQKGDMRAVFGPQLQFAHDQQVDFVALSFITSAQQIKEVWTLVQEIKADFRVITKIEQAKALGDSSAILELSDGLMVARGDLALDISIEKVPLAQKQLIKAANQAGKPVITATQMLESMVRSNTPTRAEATDVANAVLDGSDALMLSEESAIGQYPVEAVAMMVKIVTEAETVLSYGEVLRHRWQDATSEVNDATARAAVQIAQQVQAKAIIAFTSGGTTALRVSKYRPKHTILAVTPLESVMTRLAVVWGVFPVKKVAPRSLDEVLESARAVALETGVAAPGDLVVITAGLPLSVSGSTNLIKIHIV